MITQYTDYDTIRALLGVGRFEVKDETLALSIYENQFLLELEGIAVAARTEYDRIKAIAAASRTTNEARYFLLVNMFAGYCVAKQLLSTASMFAPKSYTDGRATMIRAEDPYEAQRNGVDAGFADLRSRISTLLLILVPTAGVVPVPVVTFISSVSTATNPVTGV